MTIEFGPRGIALGLAGVGIASTTALGGAQAQTLAANAAGANSSIETVNVTAQRSSLDTLTAKIQDTPQSINIVPLEVMQQQGVATLQDALKNVPGITLNAGEGGTHGDLVNLRGFSAGDDYFMDGLRDTGLYDRDAFDYESVEVYKGPASTLFGRGSTGGVINQVLKNPQLYPIANFQITGGTNDEARATADVNYVLGDSAALRVNLMGQINGVEGRPSYVQNKRWGVAPAIAFGIDTDTVVSVKYLHQQEDNLPDYGIPFVFGKPAPVPRDTFYGLHADDVFASHVDVLTGRVDHKINNWLSVSDTARYGRYSFDSRQTAAIYGTANCYPGAAPYAGAPVCTGAAGEEPVSAFDPLYPVLGTPLDQIDVLRDRPSSQGVIRTQMNNTNLKAEFNTGSIKHTLVAGAEYDRETASLTRFTNQDDQIVPVPLLDPDPFEAFPGHQTTVRQKPRTQTNTLSGYLIDTIDITDQWSVIGGVRYDNFHAKFDEPLTAAHFKHTDIVVSPRAALVFKPAEEYSFYFSYGTSYNPSAENLSLAASNADLSPEKDRTFEVGGKAMLLDGLLGVTAAAFDTQMTNARITDPIVPSLQTLAGKEKVKGFELGAQGHLTDNWEIVAGYTYLDTSAIGLAGVGIKGPIPNTARNQANLWTTYDFDDGFKAGVGVNYIGKRKAGTDKLTVPGSIIVPTVPGYTTLDAMIGYQVNDHLTLQLNGYNLTDKYYFVNSYFTRPNENHAVPGAGRTFLLTASLGL